MLCHTAAGGALQLPAFAGDDALALLIMAIFSISNGWLTSSIFVASQSAIEPHRRNPYRQGDANRAHSPLRRSSPRRTTHHPSLITHDSSPCADSAASLLVCLLNGGIALGAALSFVVRYLDCTPSAANAFSCNPFISPSINITA